MLSTKRKSGVLKLLLLLQDSSDIPQDRDLIAMNSPSPQKPISRKKKGSSIITLNAEPTGSVRPSLHILLASLVLGTP